MSIASRVKEVRQTNGLTMRKFAERLGISDASISLIENEKNGISEQTIRSIVREFHVSEKWLRTGTGEMFAPQSRADELGELVKTLFADRPDSFRSALITTLLRLDPEGPEWEVLEAIYKKVTAELDAPPDDPQK